MYPLFKARKANELFCISHSLIQVGVECCVWHTWQLLCNMCRIALFNSLPTLKWKRWVRKWCHIDVGRQQSLPLSFQVGSVNINHSNIFRLGFPYPVELERWYTNRTTETYINTFESKQPFFHWMQPQFHDTRATTVAVVLFCHPGALLKWLLQNLLPPTSKL